MRGGEPWSSSIDQPTFAVKQTELRDRIPSIKLQLDVLDRCQEENADLAVKVFELSQTLRSQWLTADCAAKRKILEIVCLNCRLDAEKPAFFLRKPFDALADGLPLKNNRSNRTPVELFLAGLGIWTRDVRGRFELP